MLFVCEKGTFQNALLKAAHAVSNKTTIPALEGLLLTLDNTLSVTGYNLETGIRTNIEVDARQPGEIVVSAKLLADIVRKMPDCLITFESTDKNSVKLTGGMTEFNIIGMPASDYPEFPSVSEDNIDNAGQIFIKQSTLKAIIDQVSHAISSRDDQKLYNGALFDVTGEKLSVVALDGVRMAIRHETVRSETEGNTRFIVPGTALSEIDKIIGDCDDEVTVSVGSKHILFSIGATTVVSRLLSGDFMDYRNVLPKSCVMTVTVDRREMIDCIERLSLLISEKLKTPIRCVFEGKSVRLFCNTALGSAQDEVAMSGGGDRVEVGFNGKYLLDSLRAAGVDEVKMELSSSVSPCVIRPVEGDDFILLVLPVRLKNE